MKLQSIAQTDQPEYPVFEDYRVSRLSRCAKIKVAVALGSLAVLGAAGVTAYYLVQQLKPPPKPPPPLRRMMLEGGMAMAMPPPQPVRTKGKIALAPATAESSPERFKIQFLAAGVRA